MVIENVIQLILTSLLLYGIIHVSLNLNFTGIGKILRLRVNEFVVVPLFTLLFIQRTGEISAVFGFNTD